MSSRQGIGHQSWVRSTSTMQHGRLRRDCVCTLTRRAARSVNQLYDAVLAPIGIKASQFILLQTIADAGQIAHNRLACELLASVETLSRRLATIRNHGWIELVVGSNHREHVYRITTAGREQIARSLPYWHRAEDRLLQQLGAVEWQELLKMLDKLALASEDALSARCRNTPI